MWFQRKIQWTMHAKKIVRLSNKATHEKRWIDYPVQLRVVRLEIGAWNITNNFLTDNFFLINLFTVYCHWIKETYDIKVFCLNDVKLEIKSNENESLKWVLHFFCPKSLHATKKYCENSKFTFINHPVHYFVLFQDRWY